MACIRTKDPITRNGSGHNQCVLDSPTLLFPNITRITSRSFEPLGANFRQPLTCLRCGYPTTVSVFVLLERRCLRLSDSERFTTNTRDFYDCGQDYRRIGYAQHLSSISTLYRRLFDRTSVYIPNHSSASHSSQRGRKTRSTYICYRSVSCAFPSLRVSAVCSIVIYWFQDRRDMKITGLGLAYQYFRYRNPLSGYTTSCFRCYYTR